MAILIYGYTKPSYEVSTTLLINPDGSNTEMSDIFEASSGREKPKTNVMNQIGIIKAFSLNLKTLENLGWNYTWHEKDNFLVKYDMYMREPLNVEMSEGFVQLKQTPLQVKMVSTTTAEISCECKAYRNGAEVKSVFLWGRSLRMNISVSHSNQLKGENQNSTRNIPSHLTI